MSDPVIANPVTRCLGRVIFGARWLMAPIYIGLLVGLILLVVKFAQKLVVIVPKVLDMDPNDLVLAVLGLVDLSLVANRGADKPIEALALALLIGSLFILPALVYLIYSFQKRGAGEH